jgi:hypothetical protein
VTEPTLDAEAPSLIGVGAETIVDRAKALGLTWTLRLATVAVAGSTTSTQILYDGDTETSTCISLLGHTSRVGDRVMGMIVPPSGNFILGPAQATLGPAAYGAGALNQDAGTGNTTSTFMSDMPGSPTVFMIKAYDSTRLQINFHTTVQFNTASNRGRFAVNIVGPGVSVDAPLAGYLCAAPAVNTHAQVSGTTIVGPYTAGLFTCKMRWSRPVGAGRIDQFGADDYNSMSIMEIA